MVQSANARPAILLQYGPINVLTLIDSGAQVTLMTQGAFMKCFPNRQLILRKPRKRIEGVGGRELRILGEVTLDMFNKNYISCFIMAGSNPRVILGIDAIKQGKGVLDMNHNVFTWFGHEFALQNYETHMRDTIGTNDMSYSPDPKLN